MSTVAAKQPSKNVKISTGKKKIGAGQIILLFFVFLFTLFCFAPVILVFVSAFTDEMWINQNGFSFFPGQWSMNGMNSVLRYGNQLLTSYGVTIFITVVGTFLGLMVMSMYAYAICRPGFRLSRFLSIFLLSVIHGITSSQGKALTHGAHSFHRHHRFAHYVGSRKGGSEEK